MKSVAQIRAQSMERSQAVAAVIHLRDGLSPLRQRLATASATVTGLRYDRDHFHRLAAAVSEKEAALDAAVTFCMMVAPDLLTNHDMQAAAAEEAERDDRQAQEVQHELDRQIALARSYEAARHRLDARQRATDAGEQSYGARHDLNRNIAITVPGDPGSLALNEVHNPSIKP